MNHFALKKIRDIQTNTLAKVALIYLLATVPIFFISCRHEEDKGEGSWTFNRADAASSNYSPLDQINVSNVAQLQPAWTFKMQDMPKDTRAVELFQNLLRKEGVRTM